MENREITIDELKSLEHSSLGTKLTIDLKRKQDTLKYVIIIDSLVYK